MKITRRKIQFHVRRGLWQSTWWKECAICESLLWSIQAEILVSDDGEWSRWWVSASAVWLSEVMSHSNLRATATLDVFPGLETACEKYKGTISSKKMYIFLKKAWKINNILIFLFLHLPCRILKYVIEANNNKNIILSSFTSLSY